MTTMLITFSCGVCLFSICGVANASIAMNYVATWSFEPDADWNERYGQNYLSFTKGDIFVVLKKQTEWWTAVDRFTGAQGLVPRNYLVLMPFQPIFQAEAKYTATIQSDGYLPSFTAGDTLNVFAVFEYRLVKEWFVQDGNGNFGWMMASYGEQL